MMRRCFPKTALLKPRLVNCNTATPQLDSVVVGTLIYSNTAPLCISVMVVRMFEMLHFHMFIIELSQSVCIGCGNICMTRKGWGNIVLKSGTAPTSWGRGLLEASGKWKWVPGADGDLLCTSLNEGFFITELRSVGCDLQGGLSPYLSDIMALESLQKNPRNTSRNQAGPRRASHILSSNTQMHLGPLVRPADLGRQRNGLPDRTKTPSTSSPKSLSVFPQTCTHVHTHTHAHVCVWGVIQTSMLMAARSHSISMW